MVSNLESFTRVCGQVANNLIDRSPQLYCSSFVAYNVAKFVPQLESKSSHAAIFAAITIAVHSMIQPIFHKIMGTEQGKSSGKEKLIFLCNTVAIAGAASIYWNLKISIMRTLFVTAVTYIAANMGIQYYTDYITKKT